MKDLELIKANFELEQAMQQINGDDAKAFALNGITLVGGLDDLSAIRVETQTAASTFGFCAEL